MPETNMATHLGCWRVAGVRVGEGAGVRGLLLIVRGTWEQGQGLCPHPGGGLRRRPSAAIPGSRRPQQLQAHLEKRMEALAWCWG